MQISFVMLLFLTKFQDGENLQGGKLHRGVPPCGRKPDPDIKALLSV